MLPHLHQVHSQATTMCISPSPEQVTLEQQVPQALKEPPVRQAQRDPLAVQVQQDLRDLLVRMGTMVQTEPQDPQDQAALPEVKVQPGLQGLLGPQAHRGLQEVPVLPVQGGVLNTNSPLLQRWETRLRAITGSTTRLSPACPR